MRIYVYAIAKNEEKHVERFMESAREADAVFVLDTGSEDNTVGMLAAAGAIVLSAKINPWRFDTARNMALDIIPQTADICVSLDLDEVLIPGWRGTLERAWEPRTQLARHTCVCSRNADGSPGTAFMRSTIHAPGLFTWKYPVHEVLERRDSRPTLRVIDIPEIVSEHLPDNEKSRDGYLPLLKIAASEYPDDARCAHYLGREYMYRGMWDKAIGELKRHLALPSAVWDDERSASMRYIADSFHALGKPGEALRYALMAAVEQPLLRENWYSAEKAAYFLREWAGAVFFGERAKGITSQSGSCINEAEAWGAAVNDILTIAYWRIGYPDMALLNAGEALKVDPGNSRIRDNYEFLKKGAPLNDHTGGD
jgi:glycosyltransferase involved in cell wall biosynthesis